MFTFLTRITGASFPETVKDLGHKVGIEIQDIVSASDPRSPKAIVSNSSTGWLHNGFSKICRTIGPELRREPIWQGEAFGRPRSSVSASVSRRWNGMD